MHRAGELAARVEPDDFFLVQKIILRVAVHEPSHRNHDKSFLPVGYEDPGVSGADGLFFVVAVDLTELGVDEVVRHAPAQGVDAQCARQRDRGCILRPHISALAKW